ncbi:MAG TPA: glycosyltransferase, partial [Pararhizobium sp.]|nr:glycosyltransferase [Pararhizobium sp.]
IVGAKLIYPDGTLQHAGVVAGFGGLAGHWYLNKPADYGGPMNRLHVRGSMTCVTGAAMLISGACRKAIGDFDDANFAVAYNDVDYCLRAHRRGFRIVWTPFARLYHHESASRGSEKSIGNRVRFETEKANLRRLHGTADFLDPAASPLNGRNHSTPKLRRLDVLPAARTWW